ncbi:hypothetical protein [Roseococcus sp.]|uniref:hypothetical protein n=1 Tax=Roseococcus sp. TaxID=2109646 RepID=UPI003BAA9E2F
MFKLVALLLATVALAGCNASPAEMAALNAQLNEMGRPGAFGQPAQLQPMYMPQAQIYQPRNAITNCFQTGPVVNCR